MKIWKAQMRDRELVSDLCWNAGLPQERELPTALGGEQSLAEPEESLTGIYLVAEKDTPLMAIWVKPVRKTVAVRRVVTVLPEEGEDFAHYLQQFIAMFTYRFRASGQRSLFLCTPSDYAMKVALPGGFALHDELLIYRKRDQQLLGVESTLPHEVRPYVETDLAGLVDVEQRIFMPELWNDRDTFHALAAEEGSEILVATVVEQVVGYISLQRSAGAGGRVIRLGVHEDYQRFGLGKVLLAAGLRWLYQEGAQEVMLYVRRDNLLARHLYERFGFVEEGLEYFLLYGEGVMQK